MIETKLVEFLVETRRQSFTQNGLEAPGEFESRARFEEQLINDLLTTEILAQEAERLKIHEKPLAYSEIKLAARTLLAQLLVQDLMSQTTITEDEMLARNKSTENLTLFRYTLWPVPEGHDAKRLGKEILSADNKESRRQLITKYLANESVWLQSTTVPSEILNVIANISPGQLSEPVLINQKLYIVQLQDKNVVDKPDWEEDKEKIRADLMQEKVQEQIETIKYAAKVKILDTAYKP